MFSPAGEMEVKITKVGVNKGQFFTAGRIGVWDSEIYFTPQEVMSLIRLMLNFSVLKYMVILPFLFLIHKFNN